MTTDLYTDFNELRKACSEQTDYVIRRYRGRTGVAVMAPHGGRIEWGTSQIARAIAASTHTFYEFAGVRPRNNAELHIASHRFDEPQAMEVIRRCCALIVVHGCKEREPLVFVGGRACRLREAIRQALLARDFPVACHARFKGRHPNNLCNRFPDTVGIQLELSAGLRQRLLVRDREGELRPVAGIFERFIGAIQGAVNGYLWQRKRKAAQDVVATGPFRCTSTEPTGSAGPRS